METNKRFSSSEQQKQAKRTRRRRIIGTAIVASLLGGGAAAVALWPRGGEEDASKIRCDAENIQEWTSMPTNVRADVAAKAMGVTEDQVRAGRYGGAKCDQMVNPGDIGNTNTLLTVQGIGDTCMAIGVIAERVEPSYNVIAVCAAE
jgi:hypothetical protein